MFRAFAKCHKLALDAHARLGVRRLGNSTAARGLTAKAKDTAGELYIYGSIGASFWGDGITAKDVAAQLGQLKGAKTLDIYINSEGGDVFEGEAIYQSLKRFDGKKTVHVDGLAASAASFIAMAGDKIVTAEHATWMIHEAWAMGMGNAGDLRDLAAVLDEKNKAIAGIYAARTGTPAATFWNRGSLEAASTGLMSSDNFMSADEALALKLTDSIEKNAAPVDDGHKAAASLPALLLAKQTQEHIAASRTHRASVLATMEHSILQDRLRASPKRNAASRASPETK